MGILLFVIVICYLFFYRVFGWSLRLRFFLEVNSFRFGSEWGVLGMGWGVVWIERLFFLG